MHDLSINEIYMKRQYINKFLILDLMENVF